MLFSVPGDYFLCKRVRVCEFVCCLASRGITFYVCEYGYVSLFAVQRPGDYFLCK